MFEIIEQEYCDTSVKNGQNTNLLGQAPSEADKTSYSGYNASNGALPPHMYEFRNSPEIIIRPPEDDQLEVDFNKLSSMASQSSTNLDGY